MGLSPTTGYENFPATFAGPVVRPGDEGYEAVRAIWNMRHDDEHPAIIVRPVDIADVVTAVRYAAANDLSVAVRSGGHGIDARAMPHDAFVLDLSLLRAIEVDASTGRVTIQAGVRLGELDAATQEHGLVVPAGVVTDTGAAGLTLGGGIGHNARRFGATVDNVLSIDVVTADGRQLTASAEENAELFWGLRGAGQNLAIATSFTYQAHPVGPMVMSGLLGFAATDAARLFDGIDEAMAGAPRSLAITPQLMPMPPVPGVPPEIVGKPSLLMLVVYTGDLDAYADAVSGIRALATPVIDTVEPTSWLQANSIVDQFTPSGRRYHQAGGYLSRLDGGIARAVIDAVAQCPLPDVSVPTSVVNFPILGGALLDADEDSTAFSRTGAQWLFEATVQWDDREDDDAYLSWIETVVEALKPYMTSNAYTNLCADRGPEWLRGAYGSQRKWERIVALKQEWDPHNRLSYNKNVTRAAKAAEATEAAEAAQAADAALAAI